MILLPLILNLAGGNGGPLQALIGGLLGVTIIFTEIFSFVLHNRRMRDAGKSGFWAVLVLVPAMLALSSLAVLTPGLVKAHAAAVAEYEAKKASAADESATAAIEADVNTSEEGRGRRGQGGRRNSEPQSQQAFVMSRVMPAAGGLWALGSFFVMLWTLLWAARQPGLDEVNNRGTGTFA